MFVCQTNTFFISVPVSESVWLESALNLDKHQTYTGTFRHRQTSL